jgi:ADP-heptose:LPS heptosyltransferase|tara:strand:- start:381 stop:1355 length:975 start_codon:yes stop_codon:yes gene_type:complete
MLKKILIYNSGGGLGDAIQLFPLILSLKNHFKSGHFYYLGAHENHFLNKLKDFNVNIKTLDLGLKYFGFRWWHLFKAKSRFFELNLDKFDLIIDLQSKLRNTLILKKIPSVNFYSSTFNYNFCSLKKDYLSNNNISQKTILNLEKLLDVNIKKVDFSLDNLNQIYINEAKKLLPGSNYIGFSITQGNEYRKKSWPLENFIILAKKIVEMNKIPVFFVEKENIEIINQIKLKVPNSLFPEHNSDLVCPVLVTALSSRLEKGISIDNGVMHMMSLAKVPMIVLFGPTNSEKFAPSHENTVILDSNKLYKTSDISKIQVEDLLKYIN